MVQPPEGMTTAAVVTDQPVGAAGRRSAARPSAAPRPRAPCSGPPGWSDIRHTPQSARSRSMPSTPGRIVPASAAAVDQVADRLLHPRVRRDEQVGVGGDDRLEVGGEALLAGDVGDEAPHPLGQRLVRRQRRAQLVGAVAEQVDVVPVDRLDQRVAVGVVPVERADADAGALGDLLQRGVDAARRRRPRRPPRAAGRGCGRRRPAVPAPSPDAPPSPAGENFTRKTVDKAEGASGMCSGGGIRFGTKRKPPRPLPQADRHAHDNRNRDRTGRAGSLRPAGTAAGWPSPSSASPSS